MGQITLAPPQAESGEEHRRATRIRKVRPVAFAAPGLDGETFRRTVTANVSRGGMLLVSRRDKFPPAGSALTVMPFDAEFSRGPLADIAIPGRIVYTRFSPRTDLRFAGLKFEIELSEVAARSIGVDGMPDAVAHTLQALERVETLADRVMGLAESTAPSVESIGRELIALRRKLDETCVEFFHATEAYVRAWGEKRLRNTIAQRHALAMAKGVAGIRALKTEWEALEQGIPALVDAQLNRDSLWPHRRVSELKPVAEIDQAWYYDIENDRPPARIVDELRKLAGFVGRIVIRHGFDDIANDSDWIPMTHERGLVTFRGPLPISDAMRETLCRAAALQDQLKALLARAEEAKESEARAAAIRLWEVA